jgi:N-acyl-D-aspartate/D-glutamate deacylase
VLTSLPAAVSAQAQYDLILRGGRVVDGSGNPWFRADVAVRGDRIVAVGDLKNARAHEEIDASGLVVAPGFIDTHSHAAGGLATPGLSHGRPLLAQGITTVIVNPDGGGPVDLEEQARALTADGLGVNVARLVGLSSVRLQVMGMENRAPTAAEMDSMAGLIRAGMEGGGFGLSSGLFSAPGTFATTEEIVSLARVAAEQGGVYASHIRDESDYTVGVVAAVDEVIRVARESGLRGIVTHIKALGPRVWGYSGALIQRIERARREGVEVFADQYPFTASATGLIDAVIPRWAEVGGRDSLLARLADPALRPRLRADAAINLDRRGGADRIQFRSHSADRSIEGKTLSEVATERGMEPLEATFALATEGAPAIVSFNMLEDDVVALMRRSWVMTCSDGDLVPMGESVPHPRTYGTFPHKIRRYVLETGVLSLEEAVRTMTSLPATVFRMEDRGVIRPGAFADILVFDPEELAYAGTYQDPHHLAGGMAHLWVNGRRSTADYQFTGELGGRALAPASQAGNN